VTNHADKDEAGVVLTAAFADFGLTAVPNLPLNTETAELEAIADPLLAGIGQENLLVTPLQLVFAWNIYLEHRL
jgi:cell division protein FtsI/penicillin-binding protein 2